MHLFKLRIKQFLGTTKGQVVFIFLQYVPYLFIIVALKTIIVVMVMNSFPMENNRSTLNDYVDDKLVEKYEGSAGEKQHWKTVIKEKGISAFLDMALSPSHQNRTSYNTTWLFFNRIPRTGGQTIVSLLHALGNDLGYQHQEHEYRTPWQRLLTEEEQKNLATWFENNFWTKSYDRFALYVNFTQYMSEYTEYVPAYFTMVRNPVDKFISDFYYKRSDRERSKMEMSIKEKQKPGSGRSWYLRTLDECVLEMDEECDFQLSKPDFLSSIPFLCGQKEECLLFGSEWALRTAKFNAEYEYTVVGLLENMNSTLQVLEKYLPLFFTGAFNKYYNKEYTKQYERKNLKSHKAPSEKVIQILKEKLALEMDFYEFLRQRLASQQAYITHNIRFHAHKDQTRSPRLVKAIEEVQDKVRELQNKILASKDRFTRKDSKRKRINLKENENQELPNNGTEKIVL